MLCLLIAVPATAQGFLLHRSRQLARYLECRPRGGPYLQVNQLGDDEVEGDGFVNEEVEDEHGNLSTVKRKKIVFGKLKCGSFSGSLAPDRGFGKP